MRTPRCPRSASSNAIGARAELSNSWRSRPTRCSTQWRIRTGKGAPVPKTNDMAPAHIDVPADRTDFPCSVAQERFWLLDRLDPGNSAYNVRGSMATGRPNSHGLARTCLAQDHRTARSIAHRLLGSGRRADPTSHAEGIVSAQRNRPEQSVAGVAANGRRSDRHHRGAGAVRFDLGPP